MSQRKYKARSNAEAIEAMQQMVAKAPPSKSGTTFEAPRKKTQICVAGYPGCRVVVMPGTRVCSVCAPPKAA